MDKDRFKRGVLPPALLASRIAMLTPGAATTPRALETQIFNRCTALDGDIARTWRPSISPELSRESPLGLELLIIDEADRLKTAGLELVRDYFDNGDVAVVLSPTSLRSKKSRSSCRALVLSRSADEPRSQGHHPAADTAALGPTHDV